ncbi:MAG: hypothetical protein GY820_41915 [Gammaproteobacteria bacterium]|nr:hypothetical protein [Gammaproteobacteria bacterium]
MNIPGKGGEETQKIANIKLRNWCQHLHNAYTHHRVHKSFARRRRKTIQTKAPQPMASIATDEQYLTLFK